MNQLIEEANLHEAICDRMYFARQDLIGKAAEALTAAERGTEPPPMWVTLSNIAVLAVVRREFVIGAEVTASGLKRTGLYPNPNNPNPNPNRNPAKKAGDATVSLQSRAYDALLATARSNLNLNRYDRAAALYLQATKLLRSPVGLAIRTVGKQGAAVLSKHDGQLIQFTSWGRVLGTEDHLYTRLHKLQHDAEQLRHLVLKGALSASYLLVADSYEHLERHKMDRTCRAGFTLTLNLLGGVGSTSRE